MQPPDFNPYAAPRSPMSTEPWTEPDAPLPLVPASRGARLLATVIDQSLVMLPILVVTGLSKATDPEVRELTLLVMPLMIAGIAIELVCQALWRQSLGKRLLGLQVVTLDGQPASFARVVFLRNVIIHAVGAFCGLIGLADALAIFRESQRCLHDEIAATRVVRKG